MSDWKKFLKESVNEYKGTGKARGGSPEPKFKQEFTSDVKKALEHLNQLVGVYFKQIIKM